MLHNSAAKTPSRPAILSGDREVTYGQLDRETDAAGALASGARAQWRLPGGDPLVQLGGNREALLRLLQSRNHSGAGEPSVAAVLYTSGTTAQPGHSARTVRRARKTDHHPRRIEHSAAGGGGGALPPSRCVGGRRDRNARRGVRRGRTARRWWRSCRCAMGLLRPKKNSGVWCAAGSRITKRLSGSFFSPPCRKD